MVGKKFSPFISLLFPTKLVVIAIYQKRINFNFYVSGKKNLLLQIHNDMGVIYLFLPFIPVIINNDAMQGDIWMKKVVVLINPTVFGHDKVAYNRLTVS